jgi:hypothetical protein
MKARKFPALLAHVVLSISALLSIQPVAMAALGDSSDSIAADQLMLRGQLRTVPMTQYDVHQISMNSSAIVREYVTRSGTVFAVTWQGPTPPNLRQLFGGYFTRYTNAAAAQSRPGGHHLFTLNQSDLVVQSVGHMRAFEGRAYLPALLPAGVSISDLQ